MRVIPHPSKHKKYPGETWWVIDIGYDETRQRIPYEGEYLAAYELMLELCRDKPSRLNTLNPKIKDIAVDYLRWYKENRAATTYEDFRDTINLYILPNFGNLKVSQLTKQLLDDFKSNLIYAGLKPVTINKHINYFSGMLRWSEEHGGTPLGFKIPRFPKAKTTPDKPVEPLTPSEVEAIYQHIEPHYRVPYLLMVEHGMRQTEALRLKIHDVDMYHEVFRVQGKGNKVRRVPFFSDRIVAEINKLKKHGPYLVTNPQTGNPYATIWKALKRAAKAGFVYTKINHHTLRHTFATNCAKEGIEPYALQALMGHESIETTMNIYTHLGLDYVGREVAKIRSKKKPLSGTGKIRLVK